MTLCEEWGFTKGHETSNKWQRRSKKELQMTSNVCQETCDEWQVMSYWRQVTSDKWWVTVDKWRVTRDEWRETSDKWWVTWHKWCVTIDEWRETGDEWQVAMSVMCYKCWVTSDKRQAYSYKWWVTIEWGRSREECEEWGVRGPGVPYQQSAVEHIAGRRLHY